jgi:DNA-binding MarR family transcriptional regulator
MQRALRGRWHCIRNGRENGLTLIHNARYQAVLGPEFQDGVVPMYAQSSDREVISYSDQPPVLIAADDEAALARAKPAIEAAGLRVAGVVGTAAATTRIEQQGAASAIWLELSRDCGAATDRLLGQVADRATENRYPAILSIPSQLLDAVAARVPLELVELLIDADEMDRLSALSLALAARGTPQSLHDAASDKSAARLRQLSDEVSRIATTLARLSTGPSPSARGPEREPAGEVPDVSADTIRAIIRARRLRARYFTEDLFADPAWDMLLDLLQAEISHLRVPVSSLCIAAAVPATTALRWLKTMVQNGLFLRRADPHDGRRVFVELAPQTSQALRRYFAEIGQVAVI